MGLVSKLERLLPSSIVARIEVGGSKLLFDVTLGFREAISGERCLWLNPGLVLREVSTQSLFKYGSAITKDPDMGVIDVNKVDIVFKQRVYGLRLKYEGLLKPLLMSQWGSRNGLHIGRAETLWYPFTLACKNVIESLLLCEHVISVVTFKTDELVPVASLEFQGMEGGEWVYASGIKTSAIEFIVGPFKRTEYSGKKTIYVYAIGEQPYAAKRLHGVIEEVEGVYKDVYGVEQPYSQYHIVFLEKTSGYKAGTMIVLDKEFAGNIDSLKASLVHELAHTWWGGFIKTCDGNSTWLIEAVPEYMTTVLLDKLKQLKLKSRVKEVINRARDVMKEHGYKPPTQILIPINEIEEKSWRIVGEAILHEIAKEIGYDTLNGILSKHMKNSMEETGRYCLTWNRLLEEVMSYSKKAGKKIEKYLGKTA